MVYGILVLALLGVTVYLLAVKKEVRAFREQIRFALENETNAGVTTCTFDRDMCAVGCAINRLLEGRREERARQSAFEGEIKHIFTNISHDLRTPLTSASGYLQLLQTEGVSEEKRLAYAGAAAARLSVLAALTEQLLQFSQTFEKKELQIETVNVSDVLREVLAGFYGDFQARGFHVAFDIPDEPFHVLGEGEALGRIFFNLVNNALVHGTGQFCVKVDLERGEIQFLNGVSDPRGMDTERLFERFYVVDSSRSRRTTGLGLAIVHGLVTRAVKSTPHFMEICLGCPFVCPERKADAPPCSMVRQLGPGGPVRVPATVFPFCPVS